MANDHLTAVEINPFLSHGTDFSGFFHNLQKHAPQYCGAVLTGYEPDRLKAIQIQAANIKSIAVYGLTALGEVSAVAAQSGEVNINALAGVGWLTMHLAKLIETMDAFESNAKYELNSLYEGLSPDIRTGNHGG